MTEPAARLLLTRRAALDLRAIETLIAEPTPSFHAEAQRLKRQN